MRVERALCERIRVELSARLDDEDRPDLRDLVDDHLEGCSECRRYRNALMSIRRQIRVQPADEVPDFTDRIIERLGRKTPTARSLRPYLRTAAAAALATALVVGGITFPTRDGPTDIASASEIVSQIRAAARQLTDYHATFDVRERNWHADVDERRLQVAVWYHSPDYLRVNVRDRTNYPDETWIRSNATLVTDRTTIYEARTMPCPPPTSAQCNAPTSPTSRTTIHREPLGGSSPSVTDIVLPLETLASADAVEVVGRGRELLGRQTIHVRLPFWQAHVLVAGVQPAMPRPFNPAGTVDIWLDADNWFPLRFTVTEPQRQQPDLTVTATSVDRDVTLKDFRIKPKSERVVDAGFRSGDGPAFVPAFRDSLQEYRTGHTTDGHRVASFSKGLSWLTVSNSRERQPPESLISAAFVNLPSVGPAFYEPAGSQHARVVEIFDARNHIRLESNLSRETLLRIADSVPVDGEPVDEIRRGPISITRVAPREAFALAFSKQPREIPAGYVAANATTTRHGRRPTNAVVRYMDPENEYAGAGIVITATPGVKLLSPSAEHFTSYRIGENVARWSPLRGELEWIDDGVYRSVRVADFRVDFAVAIARSLR